MSSGTQARAERRALISSALIGWGVGLALGAVYLGAGMSRAVADDRAERIARADAGLRGPIPAAAAAAVLPVRDVAAAPAAPSVEPARLDPRAAAVASARQTRARELDCLAQAVYFEARGEGARGQAAVATVIMNRVKSPKFPKTVCGVVYQGASHRNGCQFSFACDGAAERVVEWNAWEQARRVAARALSGAVLRDVGSATHFHTIGVDPDWGSHMLRVAQVGLHVFYRFNPHAPPIGVGDAEDPPQFASRPVPADTQLRLAAAVAPAAAAEAARPAAQAVAAPALRASVEPVAPIVRIEAPSAKADTAAAS